MIFCQACGARNTDDARFCNMCGARIAGAGEPGGPIPLGAAGASEQGAPKTITAPSGGGAPPGVSTSSTMSGSRVSLEAVGVRSSGRTYAILAAAAIGLVALGALATWIAMRGGDDAPVAAEAPDAGSGEDEDDEVVVGDPVPAEEMPEGVDIVTTGPRFSDRTAKRTTGRATRSAGSGSASGTGPAVGSGSASGTGPGAGTEASGSETGPGTGTGAEAGSGAAGVAGAETGGGGSGAGGGRDWAAMAEDAPEERDFAMEGYSNHVRRVIREFYIRRAQSCFDHETARDGEPIRGSVVIGFTIQQSGEVTNTSVDRNTTGHETLGTCLARQVDQWRLPPPPTELGDVDMQMPFSR